VTGDRCAAPEAIERRFGATRGEFATQGEGDFGTASERDCFPGKDARSGSSRTDGTSWAFSPAYRALKVLEPSNLGQLLQLSDEALLDFHDLGGKSLKDVNRAIVRA
jgi:hypothetical protein